MTLFSFPDHPRDIQNRVVYLAAAVVMIFGFFLSRVWFLQVIKGSYYKEQSESNRIRVVYLQPPRGLIFDRRGELLANNVPSFNLYLVLEDVQDLKLLTERLMSLIEIDPAELDRRIRSRRQKVPYVPIKIKEGMSLKEVALIESHRLDLAGVQMEAEPQRNYIYGPLAAHLLGYVGEVSPSQLQEPENQGLFSGTTVGQNGVEKTYDPYIRGGVGEKVIEVDAMGHEKKTLRITHAVPGNDVYLTIDYRLQRAAEQALGTESGSIVALDVRNGEILALVSHPPFDPNLLSRTLSPATWEALIKDPRRPLTNRATQGQYPPGSTFKLVVTAAGLESREITPEQQVQCAGKMVFGNRTYSDWKKGGHGPMNMTSAIVQSCDVYFYELGRRLGIERMADYSSRFGLGRPTGIELTSEKSGVVPTPQWKIRTKREPWFPGETLSASIGQGFLTVTPLQLANLIATVAAFGDRYQPHLIKAIRDRATGRLYEFPPVEVEKVEVEKETFAFLRRALDGVVSEPNGTGRRAQSGLTRIGGKTGTAQVVGLKPGVETKSLPKHLQDHAWFIAFAPVESPRIAVVVLVENGGGGGETAAPLAKRVIEEYIQNDRPETSKPL